MNKIQIVPMTYKRSEVTNAAMTIKKKCKKKKMGKGKNMKLVTAYLCYMGSDKIIGCGYETSRI